MKNKSGYTLIEVMIVVIIVGIFLAMGGCALLCVKGCNYVKDKGVKNVGTELWEGPATNQAPVKSIE